MGRPIRVLIIEDSDDDAVLLMHELRCKGFDPVFERVDTLEDTIDAISKQEWDVVICDYNMPEFSMNKALSLMKKQELDLPFVLVSGTIGEEEAVSALKAGAHDYIMKDNLSRLVPAIERELAEYGERCRVRKVEGQLRKLFLAIEQSPTTIVITKTNGEIEYVNPSFSETTGYSFEEVVGKTPKLFKSGKQKREFYDDLWETIISGKVWKGILCNRKKNGELYWESSSISPVKNEKGVVTNYVAVKEDITKRMEIENELKDLNETLERRVEERTSELAETNKKLMQEIYERKLAVKAMQDSEEKLRAIIDNSSALIYVKDLGGRYLLINHQYELLLDMSKCDVVGKTDYDLFPKEIAGVFAENDKAVVSNMANHAFEEVIPHDDGLHTYISIRFPLYNSMSNMYAVCGISTDITERRKLDTELIKAQKLEAVGVLAGGIAHDYNNSLQAVLGYITVAMLEARPEDKIYEYLENAKKITLQSSGLTQQLLTFSKGGEPVKRAICLSDLIRDSVKLALSGSNLRCKLEIAEDLWMVNADKGQLNQVISNLIINADHAMPLGGNIKICAENIILDEQGIMPLQKGKYVRIMVEDQGTGIAKDYLQKIFDPYFTTKQKGSGLGLTSSYSIIRKHDGHITVVSEIGVGTAFNIYLPVPEKELSAEPAFTKVDERKNNIKWNIVDTAESKGRILIMDDEYAIRSMLSKYLNNLNYDVVTVAEGSEALNLYKSAIEEGNHFNAVIMDLTIPGGMGGKETMEKLLEIDPEVKAIVSSGYANDPIMANYKKYGFTGVLSKPYQMHEAEEILQKIALKIH